MMHFKLLSYSQRKPTAFVRTETCPGSRCRTPEPASTHDSLEWWRQMYTYEGKAFICPYQEHPNPSGVGQTTPPSFERRHPAEFQAGWNSSFECRKQLVCLATLLQQGQGDNPVIRASPVYASLKLILRGGKKLIKCTIFIILSVQWSRVKCILIVVKPASRTLFVLENGHSNTH